MPKRRIVFDYSCSALMTVALCAGCSQRTSTPDVPAPRSDTTGMALSVRTAPNVSGMKFEIDRVDCSSGAGVEADVYSHEGALEDLVLPDGLPAVLGRPLDAESEHAFADHFVVLDAGCYDVTVTPLDSAGAKVEGCHEASRKKVEVVDGETTEILLLSQCDGDRTGGLDVIGVTNVAPHLSALVFSPSKFTEACIVTKICATAVDPDGDPLEFDWNRDMGPGNGFVVDVVSHDREGDEATECVHIAVEDSGTHTFRVSVFDLIENDGGGLVRIEDFYSDDERDVQSRDTLSFPLHVVTGDGCELNNGVVPDMGTVPDDAGMEPDAGDEDMGMVDSPDPYCPGGVAPNACAGCSTLAQQVGTSCDPSDANYDGIWECTAVDTVGCVAVAPAVEMCCNGIDDDGDGDLDMADTDCQALAACRVVAGDLTIDTAQKFADFDDDGCVIVEGNFTAADLPGSSGENELSSLACVGGDLTLHFTWLFATLPSLQSVGGTYEANRTVPEMTAENLVRVGGDMVLPQAGQQSFTALRRIDGRFDTVDVARADMPSLEAVGGDFSIDAIRSATNGDFAAFRSLRWVGGDVKLQQAGVTSLAGLDQLTHVGGIFAIGPLPTLADVTALDNLVVVGGQFFIDGSSIVTLNGFDSLIVTRGNFTLFGMPNLTTVDGFNSLRAVEGFGVEHADQLDSVTGFAALGYATSLRFVGVPMLPFCDAYKVARQVEPEVGTVLLPAGDPSSCP